MFLAERYPLPGHWVLSSHREHRTLSGVHNMKGEDILLEESINYVSVIEGEKGGGGEKGEGGLTDFFVRINFFTFC